jgi:hypothetical protein
VISFIGIDTTTFAIHPPIIPNNEFTTRKRIMTISSAEERDEVGAEVSVAMKKGRKWIFLEIQIAGNHITD